MAVDERLRRVLNRQPVDRLPVVEWAAWWDKTLERWHAEGLSPSLDRYELYREFGLDVWYQVWTCAVHWDCPWSEPAHGAGRLAVAPDYDRLEPFVGTWPLNHEEFQKGFAWKRTGEAAVWFTFPGFFWAPREILGVERHLMAFYDEPELLHRICDRLARWMLSYLEELDALGTPDCMTFAEDLSYNHGPMLSESAFREFLEPYYAKVVPALKERGIRVFVDSDGDVTRCAPWFLRAGMEGILPLERQAGVDVAALRAQHPDLLMVGAFDKMAMVAGSQAIEEEFARLLPVARSGGFVPSCDHQTPPSVSLEAYRDYLTRFHAFSKSACG
jgi:hypothetical protein